MGLFSLSMVATRAAAPELGGWFVGLGRGLVAAGLAVGAIVLRRIPVPARRHWPGLLVVAGGSVIGFPVLSALAMEHVPASHGVVFTALLPGATAVAGALAGDTRPPARFWAWTAVATALVVGFAWSRSDGRPHLADLELAIGMLASAIAYAGGGRLTRELGGVATLSWALVFSLPVVLPAVAWSVVTHPPHGSAAAWTGFAYVSVVSMYLGFLAWYRALARGGIPRVSQIQTLQPLLSLGWAALLLGEPLSLTVVLVAAGVIVAVAMGRR